MHYSDTGTLIKPLWGQLFNPLQILLIPLSTHPHIFVLTTNISRKDSDKKHCWRQNRRLRIQLIYTIGWVSPSIRQVQMKIARLKFRLLYTKRKGRAAGAMGRLQHQKQWAVREQWLQTKSWSIYICPCESQTGGTGSLPCMHSSNWTRAGRKMRSPWRLPAEEWAILLLIQFLLNLRSLQPRVELACPL